ncbi:asparagine synthase-related protein [Amycolatopsis sp. NPDC051758]|uniref:asparagine synthase-related protein n=1 Tax=Amycolatopsis sp. NPDC051758 TaxID=3363935 RepID=UPI0037A53B3D
MPDVRLHRADQARLPRGRPDPIAAPIARSSTTSPAGARRSSGAAGGNPGAAPDARGVPPAPDPPAAGPWAHHTFDGREKSLLRAAVADLLPRSVTQRVKATHDPAYDVAIRSQAADLLASPGGPTSTRRGCASGWTAPRPTGRRARASTSRSTWTFG